jgi:hypothetical protein
MTRLAGVVDAGQPLTGCESRSCPVRRGRSTILLHLEGRVRTWPSFRLAPDRTEGRSQSRPFSRVRAPGRPDPLPVDLRSQTALTVILLGFKNGRAGRMVLFACARRVYGAQPGAAGALGLRTAAAAVATALRRAAAAGAASSPAAARRPPSAGALLSRRAAHAVTRRQARGALRAPLRHVQIVFTDRKRPHP